MKHTKTTLRYSMVLFLCFSLQPSAFSLSTNKTLMVNTNNALPPSEANFFQVNSNLLNSSVAGAGGGAIAGVLTNNNAGPVTLNNVLTIAGTNASVTSAGNTVTLTLAGQGAGGTSQTIQSTPAGLVLGGQGYLNANSWMIGPALTVQNNATINTNLTVLSNSFTGGTNYASNGFVAVGGTFTGSGAGLNGLPAGQLTGTEPQGVLHPLVLTNNNAATAIFAGDVQSAGTVYAVTLHGNPSGLTAPIPQSAINPLELTNNNAGAAVFQGAVSCAVSLAAATVDATNGFLCQGTGSGIVQSTVSGLILAPTNYQTTNLGTFYTTNEVVSGTSSVGGLNVSSFITNGADIRTGALQGVTEMVSSNEIYYRSNWTTSSSVAVNVCSNSFFATNSGAVAYELWAHGTDMAAGGNYSSYHETGMAVATNGGTPAFLNVYIQSGHNVLGAFTPTAYAGGFYFGSASGSTDTEKWDLSMHIVLLSTNTLVTTSYPMP